MILKTTKILTRSQRHLIKLNKRPLLKIWVQGKKNSGGRNKSGKITTRHKGGGHKRKLRRLKYLHMTNSIGIVCSIEYDPNRKANIASIFDFLSYQFFYILAPKNLIIGDIIKSGKNGEEKVGHSLQLSKISIGTFIHNVCLKPMKPAKISRAAGTASKLIEKNLNQAKIEFSSGMQKFVSLNCFASIGIVSNELAFLTKLSKAGQARWFNKRPSVRGVAMNATDHPNGGGEGKKACFNKTPWGKPAKKKH